MADLNIKRKTSDIDGRRVNAETAVILKGTQLTVNMHTWADGLRGDHITHDVLLMDEVGNELWRMPGVLLGVSGKGDRKTSYAKDLPPKVAQDACGVVIRHDKRGGSAFQDWLARNWKKVVEVIIWIGTEIAKGRKDPPEEDDQKLVVDKNLGATTFALGKNSAGEAKPSQRARADRPMTSGEYAEYERRVEKGEAPQSARQPVTNPQKVADPEWKRASDGVVPEGAFKGGQEPGRDLYVCRAEYSGGVHPGKLVGKKCNIGYGGKEIGISNYEVLTVPSEVQLFWVAGSGGSIPPGAVKGGQEAGSGLICLSRRV